MNEMDVLARFRSEVPSGAVSGRGRSAVFGEIEAAAAQAGHGAVAAPRLRGSRWRDWRLAGAGVAGLATAGAVIAGMVVGSGGAGSAPVITVRELAFRAAATAASQPSVPPGHWVYWRERVEGGKPAGVFAVWTTADAHNAAYVYRGKVRRIPLHGHRAPCPATGGQSGQGCGRPTGQPQVFALPHGQGVTWSGQTGNPLAYTQLRSLPRDPVALDRFLAGLAHQGHSTAAERQFGDIQALLTTYVMPPALTAELYRALAAVPGVTVDRHAADVAGRTGIGLRLRLPGNVVSELIVSPRDYHLLGVQLIAAWPGSHGTIISGTAVLRKALVSRPGQLP